MREPVRVAKDTYVLPATLPVPSMGVQYVNPLLIRGAEPLLVDTGAAVLVDEYLNSLKSMIDLEDIRWIFLSHDDRDHSGGLLKLLELCPKATVITSFQAVNRITKETPLPVDRMMFTNVGESVQLADRKLHLVRPPLFDSPSTRGFWDDQTGLYYAVDAFGAITPEYSETVTELTPEDYRFGFYWLNRANTPWLSLADPKKMEKVVDYIRSVKPSVLASYHGPIAFEPQVEWLYDLLLTIPVEEEVKFPSLEDVAAMTAESPTASLKV